MKQIIAVRKDIGLSKGKTAAQVAHASLGAFKKAGSEARNRWESEGEKKVVAGVEDEDELFELKTNAENLGLPAYLVKDAGRTEIPSGTTTALAIGPGPDEEIDKITGHLSLVK